MFTFIGFLNKTSTFYSQIKAILGHGLTFGNETNSNSQANCQFQKKDPQTNFIPKNFICLCLSVKK